MKAVILTGGKGSRLRSISGGVPKPMMPLLGTPLLEHTVSLLRENGFDQLCLALCYCPDIIREHFGDGSAWDVHIEYREEPFPLGTAGAVRNCADFICGDPFLVMSGDSACDFDLRSLIEDHREGITIALASKAEPLPYGLVLTDRQGRITGFLEKPAWERVVTDQVSTGIYALSADILPYIPEDRPCDFAKDLFPMLLRQGVPMQGRVMDGYWCDIGTPRAYYQCNLDALDGLYQLPGAQAPRRILPCRDRARLMHAMSEALAEFGADYTNGLSLSGSYGTAHLAPLPDRCALLLEGDRAAVQRLAALAKKLEARTI